MCEPSQNPFGSNVFPQPHLGLFDIINIYKLIDKFHAKKNTQIDLIIKHNFVILKKKIIMENAKLLIQLILALGIYNVWIINYTKGSKYRGGKSTNMSEEF